DNRLGLVYWF
nr:Chain D, Synthetic peptide YWF [synthetic construct]2R3Y_E Chain E, Synthetic peptide YWF [synthetic construct]2R3Y_F Chain F, Synthetic peptide YWF [synthetic construct]